MVDPISPQPVEKVIISDNNKLSRFQRRKEKPEVKQFDKLTEEIPVHEQSTNNQIIRNWISTTVKPIKNSLIKVHPYR